jgi:hypothetical protein
VDALPMVASCTLDETGLRAQYERYRKAGAGARLVDHSKRSLTVELDAVSSDLVEEIVAVERECCPFFDLRWQPGLRRLTVSVGADEHEPALGAILFALGLDRSSSLHTSA